MMQLVSLADAAATQSLGAALGQVISAGTVLLLNGDLGSGKTTFVQGLGAALGVEEPIVSPTFTLINEYPEARIPLYHFDLYRLQPHETTELFLEAYWNGEYPAGVVAIEWAERLKYLPLEYLTIRLLAAGSAVGEPVGELISESVGKLGSELATEPEIGSGRLAQFEAIGAGPQQQLQALLAQLSQLGSQLSSAKLIEMIAWPADRSQLDSALDRPE